jgi:hypothetical protein
VRVPKWASQDQQRQLQRYVEGSNRAVAANARSGTGRVASAENVASTKNEARAEAEEAAAAERARAEEAGTPCQMWDRADRAGHVGRRGR